METANSVESSNSFDTPILRPSVDVEVPGFVGQTNSKVNSSIEEFISSETSNFSRNDSLTPDSGSNQKSQISSNLIENESSDNSHLISHQEVGTVNPTPMDNNLNPHKKFSDEITLSDSNANAHQEEIDEVNKSTKNSHSPEGITDECRQENDSTCELEDINKEWDKPLTPKEAEAKLNPENSIDKELPPPTSETISDNLKQPSELQVEEIDEWLDILGSGHLMKKLVQAGTPDTRPSKSDICTISFTGRLEDGTVVEKADNLKIHLNDNEVIQGIDFALALMDKGEEAELKVGPRFAYGTLGRKPDIAPGTTLFYNVKLIDVEEEPPIQSLSVYDRIALGLRKKERGNWWYSREEHSIAINCYRRALEYLDDTDIPEPHNENDVQNLLEERLKTCNNLCISQMKIHAYDAALMSVNNVLTAQPRNVKALFRKAKILKEKGELQDSIDIIRQALSLEPDSPSLQQELALLLAAQRKANSKQRELYKKMLGTNASQEKENDKKSSKNNYNALKWVTFISFAVAVIGTIAIKYKA